MGIDDIKDKAQGLVEKHEDKIDEVVEKVADFIDDKTGGRFTEKIESAEEKVTGLVSRLAGSADEAVEGAGSDDNPTPPAITDSRPS